MKSSEVELVTSRHLLNRSFTRAVYSPADRESQQVKSVEKSQQVNRPEVELVTSRHLLNRSFTRAVYSPADRESQQVNCLESKSASEERRS